MEKYFVTYNQSLALKELGFDMPCFGRYQIGGDFVLSHTERYVISNGTDRTKYFILRPLKSQVFEWFRDKHNLYHSINPLGYNMCLALIGELGKLKSCNVPEYGNYEEAESACIDKLIEIIKLK